MMMLRANDLNSMKEVFKQRMLQQEIVFKNQVRELHRLYWTQKNLMRESQVGLAKTGNVVGVEEVEGKFVDSKGNGFESFNQGFPVEAYIGNFANDSIALGLIRPGSSSSVAQVVTQEIRGGLVLDLNVLHAGCNERWREHKTDHYTSGNSESSVAGVLDAPTDANPNREHNSSKPMLIDLNIPQDDDSANGLNDPQPVFSSPSSTSSAAQFELFWKDQGDQNLKEHPAALNLSAPYSASAKSAEWLFPGCQDSWRSKVYSGTNQENEKGNNVQESNSTGITEYCRKSVEGFSSGSNEELPSKVQGAALSSKDLNVSVDENEDLSSAKLLSITLSYGRQTPIVMAENITGEKQDSHKRKGSAFSSYALAQQDGLSEKLITGTKSDILTGSTETSSLETNQDENSETSLLDNNEQQHDHDHSVVDAAEILAGMFLTQPSSPPKDLNGTQIADIMTSDDDTDQLQYSSDSFEAMTLDLPEVSSEELWMPSKQFEENTGDDGRAINKLRRGRGRMRDFQKDILPGMVSLSRHEICEDMHSIGYEPRKKNGSRRAGRGNWFAPIRRSRRSRRYPVGQRH